MVVVSAITPSEKVDIDTFNSAMVEYRKDTVKFSNEVSREMSLLGTNKGRIGEYIVKTMFEDLGATVKVLNGYSSCDLLVTYYGKTFGVEVKTAAFQPNTKNYMFGQVKPNKYDMLVLVFIDEDETIVKIGGMASKKYISKRGSLGGGMRGYNIAFDINKSHSKGRAMGDDDGTGMVNWSEQNVFDIISTL